MSDPVSSILVIGRAKTGTTILAKSIQHIAGAERRAYVSEPPDDAGLRRAVERSGPCVAKVIFEHWLGERDALAAHVPHDGGLFSHAFATVRDPRDEFISRLMFYPRRELWDGTAGPREIKAWAAALRKKEATPHAVSLQDLFARYHAIFGRDVAAELRAGTEHLRAYFDFLDAHDEGLTRIRYEDIARGDFTAAGAKLGQPVTAAPTLGEYGYTRRTASSGDWRRVATPDDVTMLRDWLGALCERGGYTDWTLDEQPQLSPSNYSEYAQLLLDQFNSRPGAWKVRLKRWAAKLARRGDASNRRQKR